MYKTLFYKKLNGLFYLKKNNKFIQIDDKKKIHVSKYKGEMYIDIGYFCENKFKQIFPKKGINLI